jgi:O-antigen/teichoic acid export membrane protein
MRFAAIFRVSKNAGALLLGTMLRMLFAFAFVVFAARFLGVAGYGKFALTQHLFELTLSLSATGLGILVTREVAKDISWLSRNIAAASAFAFVLGALGAGLLVVGARHCVRWRRRSLSPLNGRSSSRSAPRLKGWFELPSALPRCSWGISWQACF